MSRRKNPNKFILKSTYIFFALFALMIGYFAYFLQFQSDSRMNNSYNKVVNRLSESTIRGTIYSNSGEPLAVSVTDDDGNETRYYPYGEVFCHVVGELGHGKSGLELLYNYQLYSCDTNWISKIINNLMDEKYEGNNLISTLDTKLQQAAYDAMGDYKGAVVIMEADTGKVLTMMSTPSYDPNTSDENWDIISTDSGSPILNRATQGLYTPGSIFKIFTLEEYIEEGNSIDDYTFNCTGTVVVDDQPIKCVNNVVHGPLNLYTSFYHSCNGSFINIGSTLSIESFSNLCNRLLFNSELPLEFPYKKSSFVLKDDDTGFIKAQTYFGQGQTLVTPMHMALVASAIANDGVLMKPMFVTKIENAYGSTVKAYEPEEYGQLFTSEQAETLQKFMAGVITEGTGWYMNVFDNITIYGKTGTAQVSNGEKSNSWFVGYYEYNGKKYAMSVVCEQVPKDVSPAPTIARDILKILE